MTGTISPAALKPDIKLPFSPSDKYNDLYKGWIPDPNREKKYTSLISIELPLKNLPDDFEYTPPDTARTDTTGTSPDTTQTNPELPEGYRLQVYPNPVEAGQKLNLIVHIPEPGNYRVEVFNLLGQVIWEQNVFINQENTEHIFQLPTTHSDGRLLPRGIYFARFTDRDGKTTPAIQRFTITPQP
ncbi:MAG: T9SS type A sorting domain-containing protein [candidate division KSB1 bacterium]|nr:T9SS type A sorting domain-containing protein [candidate division KSB1 bacterium]